MEFHFIDVGCGNMTLIRFPTGQTMIYDCNITVENQKRVISYLDLVLKPNTQITVFVNSHRDADHFNGIKILHKAHPIQKVWDSGQTGTTPDSPQYLDYMEIRRLVGFAEIETGGSTNWGEVNIKVLNSKKSDYSDPNDQSIVLKLSYKSQSMMLTGDTTFKPWKDKIVPKFSSELNSTFLLASHHGSNAFFEDPSGDYYEHIRKINPYLTIVSVGPNTWDLPDKKALKTYDSFSRGLTNGDKVYTTQTQGTIKVLFDVDGIGRVSTNQ
jgi:beta-lactamase superfamily II metal-dependent hydrolase